MKTLTTYYQSKLVTVRNSIKEDCFYVAKHMRKQDAQEAWIANHMSPIETTLGCFQLSSLCFTIDRNGFAVAMFGVIPKNLVGEHAMIWMLCTDGVIGIEKTFVRNGRKLIDIMLSYYPFLYSHVSVENDVSFKWLKFIGAKICQTVPYGIEHKLFRYLYFTKG